ncbi:hypothetical protein JHK85_022352 [Glycine max]|uniref:UBN2 domain-containing protein n=1 Tax=Glycine max TaxID=3847 RepID=A0A0R0IPZ4_SOYBN|nr:hypothetical protein JHK85_022352 [Glycine max]KAG5025991.1 hypothetical protein JHK86_021905 [Glycine max]
MLEQKELLAKWKMSNRLSLIAIKRTIFGHLLSGLLEKATTKKFFDALGKRYQVSDNVKYECLMKQLMNIKYDNVGDVREFIMKMVHIQTKLKSHQIDFNEKFIVKYALNSLPTNFTQIKIAHNTIEKLKKEKNEYTKFMFKHQF